MKWNSLPAVKFGFYLKTYCLRRSLEIQTKQQQQNSTTQQIDHIECSFKMDCFPWSLWKEKKMLIFLKWGISPPKFHFSPSGLHKSWGRKDHDKQLRWNYESAFGWSQRHIGHYLKNACTRVSIWSKCSTLLIPQDCALAGGGACHAILSYNSKVANIYVRSYCINLLTWFKQMICVTNEVLHSLREETRQQEN